MELMRLAKNTKTDMDDAASKSSHIIKIGNALTTAPDLGCGATSIRPPVCFPGVCLFD